MSLFSEALCMSYRIACSVCKTMLLYIITTSQFKNRVIMFETTFNNISVISWRSVVLVGDTWVLWESHRHVASHWKLYHIMLYRGRFTWAVFELTTTVVIRTDRICSYKSNYHTITTTPTSQFKEMCLNWYMVDKWHAKWQQCKFKSLCKACIIQSLRI